MVAELAIAEPARRCPSRAHPFPERVQKGFALGAEAPVQPSRGDSAVSPPRRGTAQERSVWDPTPDQRVAAGRPARLGHAGSVDLDTCKLPSLGDHSVIAVPHVAGLIYPIGINQLGALKYAYGTGGGEGADVCRQLNSWHPTGEPDVQRGWRERIQGEQQGRGVENLIIW